MQESSRLRIRELQEENRLLRAKLIELETSSAVSQGQQRELGTCSYTLTHLHRILISRAIFPLRNNSILFHSTFFTRYNFCLFAVELQKRTSDLQEELHSAKSQIEQQKQNLGQLNELTAMLQESHRSVKTLPLSSSPL